ncbi:MAG TPA: hypothetical protein DDZ88_28030 [Verrucomicrobiales bacterium]|nr:hypothetical protein [Verrucomicrobiales bacterium]
MWINNASFNTLLGIYSGTAVNSLTMAGSAAFGGTAYVQVQAGTTYRIAVDGYDSSSGSFTLNIGSIVPPPANDSFASRIILPGGQTSTTGSNSGASKEAGEPDHAGLAGGKSVWWSWTAPAAGEVTLEVAGATFYPLMGVYTGTQVASLTSAGVTGGGNFATFNAAAGVTYHIAVDTGSMPYSGSFTLKISDPVGAPGNDSFASRTLLSGGFVKANGYNNGATKEAGEPLHAGNTGGKSVWYTWTAPSSGTYNAYLQGLGNFNNYCILALYTGSSVEALAQVGSASWGAPATVSFAATAGTTYQIAVDGASYTAGVVYSGSFVLCVSQTPANNDFASAIGLGSAASGSSASWIDFGTNTESGEPGHPVFFWMPSTQRTIWWTWTAPADGFFSFDTLGADFDTVLEVFTGSSLSALSLVAENHDANDSGRSSLALNAVAGTTYHIRVSGETLGDIGAAHLQYSQINTPGVPLGRAYLQQQNAAALANADAQFAAALAIDADHAEANFLKALTGFAMLEQAGAFQSALAGLGVAGGDLYQGGYSIPRDANGDLIATPGTHTSHAIDYLGNTVLPALSTIRAHLAKASAPSFQASLSDSETTIRYARIDAGDVSLILASTHLIEAMIRLLQTYDAGASVTNLVTQTNQDNLTAESLIDSVSNLLDLTGNDQRAAFKAAIQNANSHYQAGSDFVRNTRANPADERHLFPLSSEYEAMEANARAHAQQASDSLNGPANVAGETLDLSQAITSSNMPLRARLPGLFGNKAVSSTTPDPTFGGVAPSVTQARINDALRKKGLLYEVGQFGNWAGYFLKNRSLADQAKNADPDGDMLNNFAEFAFNLDPNKGSSPNEYAVGSLATNVLDGKKYLMISFVRRIERNNIHYVVAVSDNLTSWDRTQTQIQQYGAATPNPDGVTETVIFRVLADPAVVERKFVRVEVTDLEP